MSTLDRFYAYCDEHRLRISVSRTPGATWIAWVTENYSITGHGRSFEDAIVDLARDVSVKGLERDVRPAPAFPEPVVREKLPPFLVEVARA